MSLRRTALPIVLLLASCAIAAAAGCGGLGVASSDSFAPAAADSNAGSGGAGGDAGTSGLPLGPADAGVTPPLPTEFSSSPLCGHKPSNVCNAQLDNAGDSGAATNDCYQAAKSNDAGALAYPDAAMACHVARDPQGQGLAPVCTPDGTTTGTCFASAQCMAGHECVGANSNTQAQCRKYCCEANACEPTTFCDVQPIVSSNSLMVPVCMPTKSCELLSQYSAQCPADKQCGVALDAKALEIKTCLDIGPRGIGEDCETNHCDKDLVCLGAPGARKCFQLCDTAKGSGQHPCPMGQACRASGTTFSGVVGICGS